MSRRRIRAAVVALALGVSLLGAAAWAFFGLRDAARGLRSPRANLVLFSIDTCRANHLSLYRYPRPTSPALERLARDAVVFDQAISAAPVTAPSHMSLLTGLPPTIHGVNNFENPDPSQPKSITRTLPPGIRTLAEMLKARGYRTGAFTGGGNVMKEFGFGRGFDVYEQGVTSGTNGNGERDFSAERPLKWVEAAHDGKAPFFLFVHTYIPHSPYLPPPPYDTRYNPGYAGPIPHQRDAFFRQLPRLTTVQAVNDLFWKDVDPKREEDVKEVTALYDGELNAADDAVAKVLAGLDRLRCGDDTIVVITSDHGEEFLEHGEFRHPGELWDELVRVPLVMALPRTRGAGRRVEEPASALDVVPTLLDLLALPADPQPLGVSLLKRMERRSGAPEPHPTISEFVSYSEQSAEGEWAPRTYLRAVRSDRYKLIRRVASGGARDELYDLVEDPGETRNRASEPALAAALRRLASIFDGLERVGQERRSPAAAADRPSEQTLEDLKALGYVR